MTATMTALAEEPSLPPLNGTAPATRATISLDT
jgi:hypothetical protein